MLRSFPPPTQHDDYLHYISRSFAVPGLVPSRDEVFEVTRTEIEGLHKYVFFTDINENMHIEQLLS